MSAVVRPAVSAKVGTTVVRPRELRATLDAGAVLYGTADIVLPLLSVSEVEGIDPRTGMRCTFDLGERDAPPRSFDLGIRSRVVNHKSKEVRLSLATDEALLQDYKPLTDDPGPFDRQSSVRTLCGYVLSKIGATLSSDGAGDVPVWVNYVRNPRGAVNTQYWAGDTNSDAPIRMSSGGPDGGPYVYFNQTSAGQWRGRQSLPNVPVAAGDVLEFEVTVRTWTADTFRVEVNASGTWSPPSAEFTTTPGAWKTFAGTLTVSGGSQLQIMQMISSGTQPMAWDVCHWRIRHASNDRPYDMLTWKSGTSAWEFIEPITASLGLRLYCDETRVWRLVAVEGYALPGRVTMSPLNSTEGSDTIDRAQVDVSATGVVVRFRWTDQDGTQQERIDSAGTPERVAVIDVATPYPGAGLAQAILTRRTGRGRVQDVTSLAQWSATPYMEASVSLPGTAEQIGRVQAVEFNAGDGTMRVVTRGLTAAPPESWLKLAAGQRWTDSPAGASWTAETV